MIDTPVIQTEHLLCDRHAEPFRHRPGHVGETHVPSDVRRLLWAVATAAAAGGESLVARPACCRTPPVVLMDLYRASGVGARAGCHHCKRLKDGTPYRCRTAAGLALALDHLCFECLVFRTKPLPPT